MKTTVLFHSADFDGIFCREIARKFLPDAEFIGWDFGDDPLPTPEGDIYVLDLPVDRPFGFEFAPTRPTPRFLERVTWIDHHKSAIASHPNIAGYRIDGVAACRLAWQWFTEEGWHPHRNVPLPPKQNFIDHRVIEPLAVRLAGEYDIWDRRDPRAELFQHGLRAQELTPQIWDDLLQPEPATFNPRVTELLERGKVLQYARTQEYADIITHYGFDVEFEGLKFLACNHARFNSHLFTAGLRPDHDACFGFKWTGKEWSVSLYHAPGKEHHDLSLIAVKHGGGGHRGACGFGTTKLPFL